MKLETFTHLIESLEQELIRKETTDKAFEALFGGDSQILSDAPLIDNVIKSIVKEYVSDEEPEEEKELTGLLDEFIYRIRPRDASKPFFYIEGKPCPDTIENLWCYLEGKPMTTF